MTVQELARCVEQSFTHVDPPPLPGRIPYSTTFGTLRAARATAMRRANASAERPDMEADEETVLIVGSWTYAGAGWRTSAAAALALTAADAARARRPAVPQPAA